MNLRINCWGRGSECRRSALVLSLVIAAAGLGLPSLTFAVLLATTQVSKLCEARAGGDLGFDQSDATFQPYAQATSCNVSAAGVYLGQPATASAAGYASAGFGTGFPNIGMTSAGAEVSAVNAIAEANLLGSLQYHFEIQPLQPAPAGSPQVLPALFGASGAGQINNDSNSLSRAQGLATLSGPGGNYAYFSFDLNGASTTGGFSEIASFSAYPNTYGDATYVVVLSAACSAWTSTVDPSSTSCSAAVGPSFLGFDQAAFDAIMGDDTFVLNDYYRFVVSANVVPVPPAVWLFGSGLLGLIGVARYQRRTG